VISSTGKYWSTGIVVSWRPERPGHAEAWGASLDFCDDGFVNDDPDLRHISTEGRLYTRYAVEETEETSALALAIDVLIADAAKLGIEFRDPVIGCPMLYYRGDGEDSDCPPPPGYRELLAEQARRIGWASYGYAPDEKAGV